MNNSIYKSLEIRGSDFPGTRISHISRQDALSIFGSAIVTYELQITANYRTVKIQKCDFA